VGLLAAATPEFFEIMENCLAFVEIAGVLVILSLNIILTTTLVDAPKLSLLCNEFLFLLLSFGHLFFFLFLVYF
jgi:hypothetical protein